ncbi:hypothetical protein M427DRAFT_364481 [Gonapodya prolifera JEL478]|uniref:RNI-like protein n=1 Tax=Gonapodya prolifera (strain JEL478) TaxID=1344416 RepID=A0A139AA97_GONPJ|nr:hypothetical protein M427DRAFT_364481 [Gonapodya prolifera JEL478]|eukprot:KXS13584.1 hypothetical protein M427DRAFT_364481 [Gonapodya prolifera JEL478]
MQDVNHFGAGRPPGDLSFQVQASSEYGNYGAGSALPSYSNPVSTWMQHLAQVSPPLGTHSSVQNAHERYPSYTQTPMSTGFNSNPGIQPGFGGNPHGSRRSITPTMAAELNMRRPLSSASMPDERTDRGFGFDRAPDADRRRSRDLGLGLGGTPLPDRRAMDFSQIFDTKIPDFQSFQSEYPVGIGTDNGMGDFHPHGGDAFTISEQRTVAQHLLASGHDTNTDSLTGGRMPLSLASEGGPSHASDHNSRRMSQTAQRSPWHSPTHQRSVSDAAVMLNSEHRGQDLWSPIKNQALTSRPPSSFLSDSRDGQDLSAPNSSSRGPRRPETWAGGVNTIAPIGSAVSVHAPVLLSRGGSGPWTPTAADEIQSRTQTYGLESQLMQRDAIAQQQSRRYDFRMAGPIQHHSMYPAGRTPSQQGQISPRGFPPGRVPSRQPSYGDELRRAASFPDAELAAGRLSLPSTPIAGRPYGYTGRRTPPAQDLRMRVSRTASGSYERSSLPHAGAWEDQSYSDGLFMNPVGPRQPSLTNQPFQGPFRSSQVDVSQQRDLEFDARMAAAVATGRWPADDRQFVQTSGRPSPSPQNYQPHPRPSHWEDTPASSPLETSPPDISPLSYPKGGTNVTGSRRSPDLPTQRFDFRAVTDAEEFFPSPKSPGDWSVDALTRSNRSSPGPGAFNTQMNSDRTVDAAARMLEALSLKSRVGSGGTIDALEHKGTSLSAWKAAVNASEPDALGEILQRDSSSTSKETTAVASPSMETLPLTPPSESTTEASTRAATPQNKQPTVLLKRSSVVSQMSAMLIRKCLRHLNNIVADLRSCALVNKSFSSAAIPLLWERVVFENERVTRRVLDALERRVQSQQVPPCVFTKQLEVTRGMSDQTLSNLNLLMRMAGGGPRVAGQGTSGLKYLSLSCPALIDAYVLLRMFDGAAPMAMERLQLRGPGCGEKNSMGTVFQQLSQLRSLTLRHCPRIGNGVLNALSIYTKDLEELTIDLSPSPSISSTTFQQIVPGLVSDEGFIQLVRNCRKLRSFCIVDCDIGDQGLEILASSCRDLEVVELVATERSDVTFSSALGLQTAPGGMTYPMSGLSMDVMRPHDVGISHC